MLRYVGASSMCYEGFQTLRLQTGPCVTETGKEIEGHAQICSLYCVDRYIHPPGKSEKLSACAQLAIVVYLFFNNCLFFRFFLL